MAGNQLKTVLMNFQKQANYRERKEKAAAGSLKDKGNKVNKKIQDKLRYLRKKSLVMENKQKQAKTAWSEQEGSGSGVESPQAAAESGGGPAELHDCGQEEE